MDILDIMDIKSQKIDFRVFCAMNIFGILMDIMDNNYFYEYW